MTSTADWKLELLKRALTPRSAAAHPIIVELREWSHRHEEHGRDRRRLVRGCGFPGLVITACCCSTTRISRASLPRTRFRSRNWSRALC